MLVATNGSRDGPRKVAHPCCEEGAVDAGGGDGGTVIGGGGGARRLGGVPPVSKVRGKEGMLKGLARQGRAMGRESADEVPCCVGDPMGAIRRRGGLPRSNRREWRRDVAEVLVGGRPSEGWVLPRGGVVGVGGGPDLYGLRR